MTGIKLNFNDNTKTDFFAVLRKRVDTYFKEKNLSRHYNRKMVIKTLVLLSGYILPFVILVTFKPSFGISLAIWSVIGLSMAGVGMSVMHDANHGAYSANKKVNYWMGCTIDLLGASGFNWRLQHNFLHHTYTNIIHVDDDIEDKLIMRFSPHTEVKWYHKLQFIYAFLLYGVLTMYWVFLKDYIQFIQYIKKGVNKNTKSQNAKVLSKILLSKLIYFSIILGIPIFLVHIPVWQVLTGYFLMHFIAGVILTVVFQLAHTVEGTSYPLADKNKTIENNWAIHQMNTTVNFSPKSKVLSWYVGGLNFQVEHHLFPGICHVHYPQIAEIVKSTAQEYGVPYLENRTFKKALRSHINALKDFGKFPTLNNAIS